MTNTCAVCGAPETVAFLERRGVPVHQNLPVASADAARAVARGNLDLRACRACGFVANVAFDAGLLQYAEGYENTQAGSPEFTRHIDGLVDGLVASGVRGKNVVEVGCGKGEFLERLCERGENTGLGFDPAHVGPDATEDGRVRFVRALYAPSAIDSKVDVIVCRHVIEHVADPVGLLKSLSGAARPGADVELYFETPDVDWILRGVVFWDFFYEHCSYFSARALHQAFLSAAYDVDFVKNLFGGQYLWLQARLRQPGERAPDLPPLGAGLPENYRAQEAERLKRWQRLVEAHAGHGPVVVWGAGAKGVTFVNLLDPNGARISAVVDVNPAKVGRYVPGTGHAIIAPTALREIAPRCVIVVNPNYVPEIAAHLRELGLPDTIVETAE